MSKHVLVAEDEPKIAQVLRDYIEAAGMRFTHEDDGDKVISSLIATPADILILDLMLPNKDGFSVCREIRQSPVPLCDLPIIMLTARIEEIDRLLGLELGADDYICKPFSPREVVARIKTILRRSERQEQLASSAESEAPSFLDIDEPRMRAVLKGERLDLTPVEFRLLKTLSRREGRVFSRDELLDQMYEDHRLVSDRTIDSHVKNLRRKLQNVVPEMTLIHSIYGVGYKYEID